jgi:hypothetical protein
MSGLRILIKDVPNATQIHSCISYVVVRKVRDFIWIDSVKNKIKWELKCYLLLTIGKSVWCTQLSDEYILFHSFIHLK